MNWEEACQILGVPLDATQKEIHAQYIYKAQLLHPDKTSGLPDSVRLKAENELKRINAAYNVLKDARTSPVDNPPKLSFKPEKVIFKDVGPAEKKQAVLEISNTGGPYTRFWVDDSPADWLKVVEAKSTTSEPLPLQITLEATGAQIPGIDKECGLSVRLENEKTKTKDETEIKVELQMAPVDKPFLANIFGPGLKNPFSDESARASSSEPSWLRWLKSGILVLIAVLFGVVFNHFSNTFIPLPILTGPAVVFSIEKWHRGLTAKYKLFGAVYKSLLNLGFIALGGLIIWTVTEIFSGNLHPSNTVNGLLVTGEIIAFGFVWNVLSNNSWRRPKLVPTFFLVALILFILMFAEIGPLAPYRAATIDFFSRVYQYIASLVESVS